MDCSSPGYDICLKCTVFFLSHLCKKADIGVISLLSPCPSICLYHFYIIQYNFETVSVDMDCHSRNSLTWQQTGKM